MTRAFSSDRNFPAHLIVNAVGADRPGIVADISKHVTDAGGNVGDSQSARLGSHFSLMMLVTVPAGGLDGLKASLSGMKNMNASIFETEAPVGVATTPNIGCEYSQTPGISA